MTNKDFFNKMAEEVITNCTKESEYIKIYEEIEEYRKTHIVNEEDMRDYVESGAAEMLGMATQRYRKRAK